MAGQKCPAHSVAFFQWAGHSCPAFVSLAPPCCTDIAVCHRWFSSGKAIEPAGTAAQCQDVAGQTSRPMVAHRFPAAALPQTVFSRDTLLPVAKRARAGEHLIIHHCFLQRSWRTLSNCFRKPSCDSGNREALPRRLRRYPCEGKSMPSIESRTSRICRAAFREDTMMPASPLAPATILRWSQVGTLTEGASQVVWDSSVPGRPCASRGP